MFEAHGYLRGLVGDLTKKEVGRNKNNCYPNLGMDIKSAFDSTSKILFGQEMGKLEDFGGYLSGMMLPYEARKSFVSGKPVIISHPFYPKDAKFISQDEIPQVKIKPLGINQIKDIDSLFDAVSERAVYCGNKLFGMNQNFENVDNCVDCSNVVSSHTVYRVKYGAYVSCTREAEHIFGVSCFPGSRFSMRCLEGMGINRCFETYYSKDLGDAYYAFNCIGCSDCMFAFNLRGKRNIVGNLQLEKEKYLELKKKLVAEMGEGLKRKKTLFSIADIAFYGRDKAQIKADEVVYDSPVPPKVEEAFKKTTKIVLGHELSGIKGFSKWLLSSAKIGKKIRGASGKPAFKIDWLPVIWNLPADRILPLDEALASSGKCIGIKEGEAPPLQEILSRVSKIASYSMEFVDGYHENCVDTPSIFTGYDVYKLWDVTNSKHSAYSSGVIKSENVFGGYLRILESQFCINCLDSTKLNSCFEVDCSYSSRGCYFSHNIENCSDCMFSFYLRNGRHAIGNLPLEPAKYAGLKKKLLSEMAEELKREKRLPSIIEIAKKAVKEKPKVHVDDGKGEKADKGVIENAFAKTTALLFGKSLAGGIDTYSGWLKNHTRRIEKCSSALSGKEIFRYDYANYFDLPKDRMVTVPESEAIGGQARAGEKEVQGASFAEIHKILPQIAFFTTEYWEGANSNLIECATSSSSNNCYRSAPCIHSKYCGYCFWPRESEHMFGCEAVFNSDFCINAYWSTKLKRCLEMDFCRSCSDSLFCHNAENVQDSMFCFNVKNLKNAIGNAPVPAEKYKSVKSSIISQIAGELERKKGLVWGIYSIGTDRK